MYRAPFEAFKGLSSRDPQEPWSRVRHRSVLQELEQRGHQDPLGALQALAQQAPLPGQSREQEMAVMALKIRWIEEALRQLETQFRLHKNFLYAHQI